MSSFNDVAVRDYQLRRMTQPHKDAQNKLLWMDKTCRMYQSHYELESFIFITIITIKPSFLQVVSHC